MDAIDFDAAGGEPVFRGGRAAGTSLELELLGTRCPAVVLGGAIYDPENLRLRA